MAENFPTLVASELAIVTGGMSERGAVVYGQRVVEEMMKRRRLQGGTSSEPSPTFPEPASPSV